jgi:hypothetical protein
MTHDNFIFQKHSLCSLKTSKNKVQPRIIEYALKIGKKMTETNSGKEMWKINLESYCCTP